MPETMLDALEELRDRSRNPGELFHAGASYHALLHLYADDLIAVARAVQMADFPVDYRFRNIASALAPLMKKATDGDS